MYKGTCGRLAVSLGATFAAVFLLPALAVADVAAPLVRVKSRAFQELYLAQGAALSTYRRVLIEPAYVAFNPRWQSDINGSTHDLSRHVTDEQAARILDQTRATATKQFADAFAAAGFEVVSVPGPGVLLLAPRIVDLYVTSPQLRMPGLSRSYSRDAGQARLELEVRDAATGAVLGRAVDRETAGVMDVPLQRVNEYGDAAKFENIYRRWAEDSVSSLVRLSPVAPPIHDAASAGRPAG